MTRMRAILFLGLLLLPAHSLLAAPQAKAKGKVTARGEKQVTITLVRWPYT
jgi:hypothetical protein